MRLEYEKFDESKLSRWIIELYSCSIFRNVFSIVMINIRIQRPCGGGLAFGISNFHESGLESRRLWITLIIQKASGSRSAVGRRHFLFRNSVWHNEIVFLWEIERKTGWAKMKTKAKWMNAVTNSKKKRVSDIWNHLSTATYVRFWQNNLRKFARKHGLNSSRAPAFFEPALYFITN